eukprot:4879644-Amphidinium_carterae.1
MLADLVIPFSTFNFADTPLSGLPVTCLLMLRFCHSEAQKSRLINMARSIQKRAAKQHAS